MCAFGALVVVCPAAPKPHDSLSTPNVHIRGSRRFKHHQNSTREPPEEDRIRVKMRAGEGKKSAKFWAPHRSPPRTLRALHFSGPLFGRTLRGSRPCFCPVCHFFILSRTHLLTLSRRPFNCFFVPSPFFCPVALSQHPVPATLPDSCVCQRGPVCPTYCQAWSFVYR